MSDGAPDPKVVEKLASSVWMTVVSRASSILVATIAPVFLTWIGSAIIETAKGIQADIAQIKSATALYGQLLDAVEKKVESMQGLATQQAVTSSRLDDMKVQLDKIERIVAETQRRSEMRITSPDGPPG